MHYMAKRLFAGLSREERIAVEALVLLKYGRSSPRNASRSP
jgi:hypothetical protein